MDRPFFGHVEILDPFGVMVLPSNPNVELDMVPIDHFDHLLDQHPFLLLRGFPAQEAFNFESYWRQLGTDSSPSWELVAHDRPNSHLFDQQAIPLHCEEILTGQAPSYTVFQCFGAQAPGDGGEITLCDTTRVLDHAMSEQRERWSKVDLNYRRSVLGNTNSRALIDRHPADDTPVLRYAEPFDRGELGSLSWSGTRMTVADSHQLAAELATMIHDPGSFTTHSWELYDTLIIDERKMLQGRSALRGPKPYPFHLRRLHVF
jgi:alpha-ketoglutarate-dependent taurine dioxygenase